MAEESQVELLLRQGIAAVKAERVEKARELLLRVLDLDPHNEKTWLWMGAIGDDEDKIVCLKNVLAINPHNEYARLGPGALLDAKGAPSRPDAELPAEAVTIDQDTPMVSHLGPLVEETLPSPRAELPAAAEDIPNETDRTCAMYFGLSALALLTFVVCSVAFLLGGMLATTGPWQAQPTTMLAQAPIDTPISTPSSTYTPTSTSTPTKAPLPTNTLVVPNARIPGFPIVNEGAYPEIEARVSQLRELVSAGGSETDSHALSPGRLSS